MKCPKCESNHSCVVDSRSKKFGIQRRRECMVCGHRFNTAEISFDEYYRLRELRLQAFSAMEDVESRVSGVLKDWNGGVEDDK